MKERDGKRSRKAEPQDSRLHMLILFLTAMIWGSSFVSAQSGIQSMPPLTFNCLRLLIAGTCLLPVIAVGRSYRHARERKAAGTRTGLPDIGTACRSALPGGIICGLILGAASGLQQVGLLYTTVGRSGFITALYIVLIPIFSLVLGRKLGKNVWIAAAVSVCGLYFICMGDENGINKGDLFTMACAVCYAVHILAVDHFSKDKDPLIFSCIQFYAGGILMLPFPVLSGGLTAESVNAAGFCLFYSGAVGCCAGFTLQTIGQQGVRPAIASLILSLESCFAALFGFLILHQSLSPRELLGCALMFAAIVLSQKE